MDASGAMVRLRISWVEIMVGGGEKQVVGSFWVVNAVRNGGWLGISNMLGCGKA